MNNIRYEIGEIVDDEMIKEVSKLQPLDQWISSLNTRRTTGSD